MTTPFRTRREPGRRGERPSRRLSPDDWSALLSRAPIRAAIASVKARNWVGLDNDPDGPANIVEPPMPALTVPLDAVARPLAARRVRPSDQRAQPFPEVARRSPARAAPAVPPATAPPEAFLPQPEPPAAEPTESWPGGPEPVPGPRRGDLRFVAVLLVLLPALVYLAVDGTRRMLEPDGAGLVASASRLEHPPVAAVSPPQQVAPPADAAPPISPEELLRLLRPDAVAERPPAPEAPKPPPADVDGPRIYVHYTATAPGARDLARRLASYLAVEGFEVADLKAVSFPIEGGSIRYFFDADRREAEALSGGLSEFFEVDAGEGPAAIRDFTDYAPKPRAGNLEVWLPAS